MTTFLYVDKFLFKIRANSIVQILEFDWIICGKISRTVKFTGRRQFCEERTTLLKQRDLRNTKPGNSYL